MINWSMHKLSFVPIAWRIRWRLSKFKLCARRVWTAGSILRGTWKRWRRGVINCNGERSSGRYTVAVFKGGAYMKLSFSHEFPKRSITKAVSWRITGTLDTFIISFIITGKIVVAGSIAGTELLTKFVLYYAHERVWARINWGRRRSSKSWYPGGAGGYADASENLGSHSAVSEINVSADGTTVCSPNVAPLAAISRDTAIAS